MMRGCKPGDLHIEVPFILRESALQNASCDWPRDFAAMSRSALDHDRHDILRLVKRGETCKPGYVFLLASIGRLRRSGFTSDYNVFQTGSAAGPPVFINNFPQTLPNEFHILGGDLVAKLGPNARCEINGLALFIDNWRVDEQGKTVNFAPRIRAELRNQVSPQDMELVRQGLWKVVNEDGGTGGRARLEDVVVAGKTGTAQATDRGQEENVAWFTCFAPFDHPKYVVAVIVQGASGHGGEVAGPIATRILERTLAQDEGNFDMQVAWLTPAHHSNPLQLISQ